MQSIGIDLGASKTVMAALRQGEPQLILNGEQSPLTPSVLGLDLAGELVCGQAAFGRAAQAAQMFLPRLGEAAAVPFNGLAYAPDELVALLLARLRSEAEAALGAPLGRVALAAPLAFGQRQVALLRQAARRAGLSVLGVVASPVAAALAYGRERPGAGPHTLLVCDFGASTLSVAVLRAFPGALTLLGQAGEGWLGGEDLTQAIVAHLVRRLQGERGVLLDEDQAARQALRRELRRAAEQAKVALSTVKQVRIALEPGALGLPVALDEPLARAEFAAMARPQLGEALAQVERALAEAGLDGEGIDAVLPVGGASRMPLWQALLGERLPHAQVVRGFNPLTGVAMGAALWAGMLGEVRCPTCGLLHALEAVVCRRCGGPLAGEPRLACPRCFLPNNPARLSCWKCGASLRPVRHELRTARGAKALGGSRAAFGGQGVMGAPEGLRCGHCGLVAPAGAVACPNCGGVVAPFVGSLSRSSLGIERAGGRLEVILPGGLPLPTAQPVYRTFRIGAGGLLEIAIYEGDKPFACQNQRYGSLCVGLPGEAGAEGSVRVAFGLDREGVLTVGASLADGSERELDAWLEWS